MSGATTNTGGGAGTGSGNGSGSGSGSTNTGGGAGTHPKGHFAAMTAQAVALVAVGLVLIVAVLTAPAAQAAEPKSVRLRPATEQERRDYDARRLAELLDERWRQHTKSPATRPEPGPAGTDVAAGPGQDHP